MIKSKPSNAPHPNAPGTNGKIVVAVMLAVGVIGGILLSRNMPYANPAEADEGSPYYSRPTDEQVKILMERHKNDLK